MKILAFFGFLAIMCMQVHTQITPGYYSVTSYSGTLCGNPDVQSEVTVGQINLGSITTTWLNYTNGIGFLTSFSYNGTGNSLSGPYGTLTASGNSLTVSYTGSLGQSCSFQSAFTPTSFNYNMTGNYFFFFSLDTCCFPTSLAVSTFSASALQVSWTWNSTSMCGSYSGQSMSAYVPIPQDYNIYINSGPYNISVTINSNTSLSFEYDGCYGVFQSKSIFDGLAYGLLAMILIPVVGCLALCVGICCCVYCLRSKNKNNVKNADNMVVFVSNNQVQNKIKDIEARSGKPVSKK